MTNPQLRDYQISTIASAKEALSSGKNPVLCLPTGSGKSLILAALARDIPGRTLVLSHRKELLQQDRNAILALEPTLDTGIYSAGLNMRDTDSRVLFAGVQSIHRRIDEIQKCSPFSLIIVDEAHLVSRRSESMYGSIFQDISVKRCGLSATPYRMDTGLLHDGDGALFDDLTVHITAKSLTPKYLSPLVGHETDEEVSTEGVHVRGGEFIAGELDQLASDEATVRAACSEIIRLAGTRKSWIVFCCGVQHARMVHAQLQEGHGVRSALVLGDTPSEERARAIAGMRDGEIQALVNVNVATTGFDIPIIDCIISLRPTLSKGLWVQQCGRGMRKAPGKENAIVLDFGGNVPRFGDMDILEAYIPTPKKEAIREQEKAENERKQQTRDKAIAKHGIRAWSGMDAPEVDVQSVRYYTVPAGKYPGKTNLVAQYQCYGQNIGRDITIRQWVCVEYGSGARWHAEQWFARRGVLDVPRTAQDALYLARRAPIPESLTITQQGRYWNVQMEHWGEMQQEEID